MAILPPSDEDDFSAILQKERLRHARKAALARDSALRLAVDATARKAERAAEWKHLVDGLREVEAQGDETAFRVAIHSEEHMIFVEWYGPESVRHAVRITAWGRQFHVGHFVDGEAQHDDSDNGSQPHTSSATTAMQLVAEQYAKCMTLIPPPVLRPPEGEALASAIDGIEH